MKYLIFAYPYLSMRSKLILPFKYVSESVEIWLVERLVWLIIDRLPKYEAKELLSDLLSFKSNSYHSMLKSIYENFHNLQSESIKFEIKNLEIYKSNKS